MLARPDLLPDRIADWIREEITQGRLPPGKRLVEQDLAQRLEVSRVPLREALRIVAADGFVTISAHRGASVAPMSESDLVELFDLRIALEGFAAAAAAGRARELDLTPLRALGADMEGAIATGDLDRYHMLASRFHTSLVELSGNRLIVELYGKIKGRFRRYQAAMARVPELPARSMEEHEGVLAAIETGDPERARALAESHIRSLVERLAASRAETSGARLT